MTTEHTPEKETILNIYIYIYAWWVYTYTQRTEFPLFYLKNFLVTSVCFLVVLQCQIFPNHFFLIKTEFPAFSPLLYCMHAAEER